MVGYTGLQLKLVKLIGDSLGSAQFSSVSAVRTWSVKSETIFTINISVNAIFFGSENA